MRASLISRYLINLSAAAAMWFGAIPAQAGDSPYLRGDRDVGVPPSARVFFDGPQKFTPRYVEFHSGSGVYAASLASDGPVVRANKYAGEPLILAGHRPRMVDSIDRRNHIGEVYRRGDTLVVIGDDTLLGQDRISLHLFTLPLRETRRRYVIEIAPLRYQGPSASHAVRNGLGARIGEMYDVDPSVDGVAALIAPARR